MKVAVPVQTKPLVLASASPRRRAILAQLGLVFDVEVSAVAEPAPAPDESPERYAAGLAAAKARDVAGRHAAVSEPPVVLGADTIVVVDDDILGKPADEADAVAMLGRLAGRAHRVVTAVCVQPAGEHAPRSGVVSTVVRFRAFDEAVARRYVASGEGRDKAGSYAIQGLGAGLVEAIEGSYSNVVGLPATQTLELLSAAGALEAWP